MIADFDG